METALLVAIEDAITAVLTLSDAIARNMLLHSPHAQREVKRRLLLTAKALDELACGQQVAFAELDRDGWLALARVLDEDNALEQEALWFAVDTLAPHTLSWLRVYRAQLPALFAMEA
jgi:hypothetical protein